MSGGPNFIIIFRLSMLDLVEGGSTLDEGGAAGPGDRAAGVTILNTGIGWHEARIPTIATKVPRGAFARVTQQLKGKVGIPLVATNRINTPEVAEQILAEDGMADMVSMARRSWPTRSSSTRLLLAVRTRSTPASAATRPAWTTLSPARVTSCLVNPRACHETESGDRGDSARRASPWSAPALAGLAFATAAARRLDVTLFEAASEIGGQFNIAMQVPGKGRVLRNAALFRPPDRADRRQLVLNRTRGGAQPGGRKASTRWCSPPASCRACRLSTALTIPKVRGYLTTLRDENRWAKRWR